MSIIFSTIEVDIHKFVSDKLNELAVKPIHQKYSELERYRVEAADAKEKGNYGRLFLICAEFLRKYPDDICASFDLIEVYLNIGKPDRAREILMNLCRIYPRDRQFLNAHIEAIKEEFKLDGKKTA